MDIKLDFNNLLSALVEEAMANSQHLDKAHIEKEFEAIGISASQMPNIYTYLKGQKIVIDGLDEKAAKILEEEFGIDESFDISKEEQEFLDMYYKELDAIPSLSEEEFAKELRLAILTSRVSNEPKEAANGIIPHSLHLVTTMLADYQSQGVSAGDLIQEGNLGLLEGTLAFLLEDMKEEDLDSYTDAMLLTAYQARIRSAIATAMQDAIDEENGGKNIASHLADRANMLDQASRELAKKLERQPSLSELAKHVSLPEDEVSNILKYSIDAMTINVDLPDEEK